MEIPTAIPVIHANSCSYSKTCTRCQKPFVVANDVKEGTAQYYRCSHCLSLKVVSKDTFYSICNVS